MTCASPIRRCDGAFERLRFLYSVLTWVFYQTVRFNGTFHRFQPFVEAAASLRRTTVHVHKAMATSMPR